MSTDEVLAVIDELVTSLKDSLDDSPDESKQQTIHKICEKSRKKLCEIKESAQSQQDNQTAESTSEDQKNSDSKSQAMKNIEVQNQRLRAELELHKRMDEVRNLANKNRALQDDVLINRGNTLKMLRFFETKAKIAEKRIMELSQELVKSQDISKRYQQAYDQAMNASQFQADGNARDADKQQIQVLTLENNSLRREIGKLHSENTQLMKKTKQAEEERAIAVKLYTTSEAAREDLMKRLRKRNQQQKQLNHSMTRQAAAWITKKKEMKVMEEEMRWSLITTTPVYAGDQGNVYGHIPKGIYMPKRISSPRPVSSLPPTS